MAQYPTDVRYTNDHEWARKEGELIRVGVTAFAVEQLGDVTLVDLPSVGDKVKAHERFGDIESVKTVSELFAPVSGEVVEVNGELDNSPEVVNEAPYEGGWFVVIRPSDPAEHDALMDAAAYEAFLSTLDASQGLARPHGLGGPMRYLPHTEAEIAEMLSIIGVSSVDELFRAIPEDRRFSKPLGLELSLDEAALMAHLTALSDRNDAARALSFLGAGAYDHHVPPAVDQLLNRSEFYTAYTPYQAELSQGTLQSIFEFQTIVCQLLGMDVANASMYDAASAAAEAVLMARRITGRAHVVVSDGLHPEYVETIRAYLSGVDGEPKVTMAALGADGRTDVNAIRSALRDESAAIVVGYPNFLGVLEDLASIRAEATARGALLVTATAEPYALSVAKSPGELGADIAVGEGQPLAVRPQFGGPGVGLFSCQKGHLRQMPGRLCGETVDQNGKRGFVLTLSTREQHIRRERATSNICTNHGLIALAMVIRTAMLGRKGFEAAGRLCLSRATYLKEQLRATDAFELPYAGPTFNEFVVRRKAGPAAPLLASLAEKGVLAGVDLGRYRPEWSSDFLVAVTECHAKADLDRLVEALVEG